jgi:hypothetical protein
MGNVAQVNAHLVGCARPRAACGKQPLTCDVGKAEERRADKDAHVLTHAAGKHLRDPHLPGFLAGQDGLFGTGEGGGEDTRVSGRRTDRMAIFFGGGGVSGR